MNTYKQTRNHCMHVYTCAQICTHSRARAHARPRIRGRTWMHTLTHTPSHFQPAMTVSEHTAPPCPPAPPASFNPPGAPDGPPPPPPPRIAPRRRFRSLRFRPRPHPYQPILHHWRTRFIRINRLSSTRLPVHTPASERRTCTADAVAVPRPHRHPLPASPHVRVPAFLSASPHFSPLRSFLSASLISLRSCSCAPAIRRSIPASPPSSATPPLPSPPSSATPRAAGRARAWAPASQ